MAVDPKTRKGRKRNFPSLLFARHLIFALTVTSPSGSKQKGARPVGALNQHQMALSREKWQRYYFCLIGNQFRYFVVFRRDGSVHEIRKVSPISISYDDGWSWAESPALSEDLGPACRRWRLTRLDWNSGNVTSNYWPLPSERGAVGRLIHGSGVRSATRLIEILPTPTFPPPRPSGERVAALPAFRFQRWAVQP